MELFGSWYVVEHCVIALKERNLEKTFRAYVTQCLMILTQNTAHYFGGPDKDGSPIMFDYGSHMKQTWLDIVEPQEPVPQDNRTVEEVVDDIWAKIERR